MFWFRNKNKNKNTDRYYKINLLMDNQANIFIECDWPSPKNELELNSIIRNMSNFVCQLVYVKYIPDILQAILKKGIAINEENVSIGVTNLVNSIITNYKKYNKNNPDSPVVQPDKVFTDYYR